MIATANYPTRFCLDPAIKSIVPLLLLLTKDRTWNLVQSRDDHVLSVSPSLRSRASIRSINSRLSDETFVHDRRGKWWYSWEILPGIFGVRKSYYSPRSFDPIAQSTVAHGQNDRNRKRERGRIPLFSRLCAFTPRLDARASLDPISIFKWNYARPETID